MPIGRLSQHSALCASQLSSLLSSQRCALNLHGQLKLNAGLLFASRLAPATLQRIPVKLTRSRRGGSSCGILHEKVSVRKHRHVGIEYEWSARKTFADRL